jgi:hypothetical protein
MLVDEFVDGAVEEPTTWTSWLPALQTRWELVVGHQPLPWFAEIKRQQGAFATMLGVVVESPRWRAVAVGDSCLFQIREGKLIKAFPVTRSTDFDCSPWLIGSRGFTAEMMALREQRIECHGQHAGEQLWLMTDALARWFLMQVEHGKRPWEILDEVLAAPDQQPHFKAWVNELRCSGQMRNDDTTLMKIWTDTAAPGAAAG